MLANSWDSIEAMHAHMQAIDVSALSLSNFVASVEAGLYEAVTAAAAAAAPA